MKKILIIRINRNNSCVSGFILGDDFEVTMHLGLAKSFDTIFQTRNQADKLAQIDKEYLYQAFQLLSIEYANF